MKKHKRGAAVILAILIVTLAASTAAFAMWQQSLWTRQMENLTDRAKADALALTALDWARGILIAKDSKTGETGADKIARNGIGTVTTPAEGTSVSGELHDMQGRFNLNNLTNGLPHHDQQMKAFQALLDALHLDAALAQGVADWVDGSPDNTTADLYYLGLDPAYRAAKQKFVDVTELARIKGFDAATVDKLAPYVAALPCIGQVANCESALNINTATPEVLASTFGISVNDAQAVLKHAPFTSKDDIKQYLPASVATAAAAVNYDVKSQFFLATVKVSSGRVDAGYAALLSTGAGATPGGANWQGIIWVKEAAN